MIQKTNGESLKEIRKRKKQEEQAKLKEQCEAYILAKWPELDLAKLSNSNGGLWYLPVWDSDDETQEIKYLLIMKPINRNILSYAATKMEDGGLYDFLGAGLEECCVHGDKELFNDEESFIAAATSFNKIIETKKAALLKR